MSRVERDGKGWIRPSWLYPKDNTSLEMDQLEMLESTRNVLEEIQRSQMLQCDVAGAIKTLPLILREIRGLRRDLKARKP